MLIEIGLFLVVVFILFYYEVTKQFGFFKDRGVPYDKPSFPFGSSGPWAVFTGKNSFVDMAKITLETSGLKDEKMIGLFMFGQPNFLVLDDEIKKQILIKDFEYFIDRRPAFFNNKYGDAFMLNLTGQEWKSIRTLMGSVFTAGKLRLMCKHMVTAGNNLEEYIAELAESGEEVDMKVTMGLMSLDSIATAGFGIETNSFKERENTFRVMAMKLIGAPGYAAQDQMIKFMMLSIVPKFAKFLGIQAFDKKCMAFFADIIKKTYSQRLQNPSANKRNDIIDVIAEEIKALKNGEKKTKIAESEFEKDAEIDTSNVASALDSGFDEETILISNALLFFFAGFDTTSGGLAVVSHRLALHQEAQEKVFNEIEDVFGDSTEITYDKIQELKYMELFIHECFRHQIMVPSLERLCVKDYKVPGTDIVIPKGRMVLLSAENMVSNPDYYKNPLEFDPENFNPENKPNKFADMAFGQGPRSCIGMRYAMLTMKVTLVCMLRKHQVVRGEKTPDKLVPDIANPNIFKDPAFVKFKKRA